jgi:hypothetical protein
MVHAFGETAFLGLLWISLGVPGVFRWLSRKLEMRADRLAKLNEGDAGTYARALMRLYEDNLTAVVTKRKMTHPHLYDRMLAAGVTPDFPRPAPAESMSGHGIVLQCALGVLFLVNAARLSHGTSAGGDWALA